MEYLPPPPAPPRVYDCAVCGLKGFSQRALLRHEPRCRRTRLLVRGAVFEARVSNSIVKVQIMKAHPDGGWVCRNLATGRKVRIKSYLRFRDWMRGSQFTGHSRKPVPQGGGGSTTPPPTNARKGEETRGVKTNTNTWSHSANRFKHFASREDALRDARDTARCMLNKYAGGGPVIIEHSQSILITICGLEVSKSDGTECWVQEMYTAGQLAGDTPNTP